MPSHSQQLQAAMQAHRSGKRAEAEKLYRQILAVEPDNPDVLHGLGTLAMQAHQPDAAIHLLRRSLEIRPNAAKAWNDLSVALSATKHWQEAAAAAQRAIELNPKLAAAHFNLGNVLREQNQPDRAILAYTAAVALNPKQAIAQNSLSALLRDANRPEEAVAAAQKSIAAKPDFAEAHVNLAIALDDSGRLDEAITAIRHAIQLQPTLAEPYFTLGNFLKRQSRFGEAVIAYTRAIELKPDGAGGVYNNLGEVLKDLARLDQAEDAYRQSIAQAPAESIHHSNLIYLMLFQPKYDSAAILKECQAWNHQHAESLRPQIKLHENNRDPHRCLRIGYVSPDFRDHVVGRNMLPLLAHHHHDQFEIHCFSNLKHPDSNTEQFRKLADHWHDVKSLTDDELANLIRTEKIDILVDLALHMGGNRLLTFARKPAPIQVTFAGYPGTTGLSAIDYRLTDPHLDPPGTRNENYTEKSVRLPHTFWCYNPMADIPVNESPALKTGTITFGCLNNFCKVNQNVLHLWSRVLTEIPSSRLFLMCPLDAQHQTHQIFQQCNVSPSRIVFVPFQKPDQYLQTYHHIDIILDTFPYNGHTTSLDALWMGVPVVSLIGQTIAGRAGVSQLTNLGLTDLLARDPDQYINIAHKLATERDRLSELRRNLRQRMTESPLMDAKGFARDIETAYREMWKEWCAK
jgi:protein O-GlcNAc transferase